jgi:hypothetical protein
VQAQSRTNRTVETTNNKNGLTTINQTSVLLNTNEEMSQQYEYYLLRKQFLCILCMENDMNILLLPCGHLLCCERCSRSLISCPQCNVPVNEKIKTFY